MLSKIIQACLLLIGGTLGVVFLPDLYSLINIDQLRGINNPYVSAIIGAVIFYLLTFWIVKDVINFIKWVEGRLLQMPVTDLLFGTLGLVLGLIVAFFINSAFSTILFPILNDIVPIILTLLLGYLGFQVGFNRRNELFDLFTNRIGKKKRIEEKNKQVFQPYKKILDTSVIIDGRIADICQAGFIEGTIVIPQFVLKELQFISDSSDTLKRNRGRRGLDILNKMKKELPNRIEIYDGDFEDIHEVDSKLVKLAKLTSGILVTNDYNLNKVCELQQVRVLNINELANAVKPVLLPGEEINVEISKNGNERNQGVGYLEDGTMIVIEEGRQFIGRSINVFVKSIIQTSAGRMIFGKPKNF